LAPATAWQDVTCRGATRFSSDTGASNICESQTSSVVSQELTHRHGLYQLRGSARAGVVASLLSLPGPLRFGSILLTIIRRPAVRPTQCPVQYVCPRLKSRGVTLSTRLCLVPWPRFFKVCVCVLSSPSYLEGFSICATFVEFHTLLRNVHQPSKSEVYLNKTSQRTRFV
jgi:hypothetical protein